MAVLWKWLAVIAHILPSVGASRLRSASRAGFFTYNYARHGQDWTAGQCASRSRQSPINFPDMSMPPTGTLSFTYEPAAATFEVSNNGNTFSADLAGLGYGGLTHENAWYNLLNVNVHAQSEHTFAGLHKQLELHLVHQRYDGDGIVVVAVPVDSIMATGNATESMPALGLYTPPPPSDENFNSAVQAFLKVAPPQANMKVSVPGDEAMPMNLATLLEGGSFFEYAGSLTAPPCSEIATWLVRREPVLASTTQVQYLRDAILATTAGTGNYRSAMPLNGRAITVLQAVAGPAPPLDAEEPNVAPVKQAAGAPAAGRDAQAFEMAKEALRIAQASADYVRDLDRRLHNATDAHEEALGLTPATSPMESQVAPAVTQVPLQPAGAAGPPTLSGFTEPTGAARPTAPPTAPSTAPPTADVERAAQEMTASIAQAAKEAIASAAQQLSAEAKKAAVAAAREAAKVVAAEAPVAAK
mmetsp:Transcript_77879/g.167038  ORF Transcript_77879/g.167038 Transcript_77879/m.167038 type:complete len:471 (-) Transcript_77879:86-1498(-)